MENLPLPLEIKGQILHTNLHFFLTQNPCIGSTQNIIWIYALYQSNGCHNPHLGNNQIKINSLMSNIYKYIQNTHLGLVQIRFCVDPTHGFCVISKTMNLLFLTKFPIKF